MAEAKKKVEATKPTPEEKQAAAEAEVDALVTKALKALDEFEALDQKQVDRIVAKASIAALNKHLVLAKMAVDETGRGLVEDKATKNIFACEHVTNYLAGQKTVGIIREDDVMGIDEVAEPVGVVAGVTPVTNPTSTAIFKSLIALKTRCPIVFGFHPGAQKCSVEAAKIVRDAAIEAGAPENCIQWIEHPSIQATGALMQHPGVATILATGGPGMVKAAYSSGKPALGVGAGNAPAYVDSDVDIVRAANDLVLSKHFDYGMICATEQAIIAHKDVYAPLIKELKLRKAYFVNAEEKAKLEKYMFGCVAGSGEKPVLNSVVPGKSPQFIAKAAGFDIPEDATILAAECKEVSDDEPLTHEKLAPVQAVLKADNKEQAFEMCEKMLKLGAGHTAAIHTNNQELVREYGVRMHACRIIWNQPSSLGGIGDIYNAIAPSLTLGCGSYGGNSVSGNVQAVNLVNIKRIARRNNNMQWFKIPAKTYFEPNAIKYLRDMYGIEKAVIVCDKVMEQLGIVDKIIDQLRARSNRVTFRIIDYVEPEPSVETVEKGAAMMREEFEPDTIIAVGGGSPMDASKIMWLLYEHPEIAFSDVREKFFDIRKRAFKIHSAGQEGQAGVHPDFLRHRFRSHAVRCDHRPQDWLQVPDHRSRPDPVRIVDRCWLAPSRASCPSDAGFDALTHSMEAYVSVYANDFTDGMALHAAKLIWDNLAESVNGEPGLAKTDAQEKMHNAATMAGMAFGSAFLGMCHGMAHTIGALCHIAHGRTNSILLPYVIRYNGQIPEEPTSWPKYNKYVAPERYQDIARNLGIDTGKTPAEAVENLAKAVEDYRDNKLGMNKSFQDCGVDEDYFWSVLDQIGMRAYEDQCTPANPRIPLINDMKDIAVGAYYGVSQEEGHKLRIEREGEAATEEASER